MQNPTSETEIAELGLKMRFAIEYGEDPGIPARMKTMAEEIINSLPDGYIRRFQFTDYESAMSWFIVFFETGLFKAPNGTRVRRFYYKVTDYVMTKAPPALKKQLDEMFSENFPELKPAGYTSDGQACYRANQIAEAMGCTVEELEEQIRDMDEDTSITEHAVPLKDLHTIH